MRTMNNRLLFTDNIGYDMKDWTREPIIKVFAGTDCVLALTSDGRLLQKTGRTSLAVRTQYWTRITDVALSGAAPCHAIGLVSDGTCLIAKRYPRQYCDDCRGEGALPFEAINGAVRSWKQITQVAVSDAFFALDSQGRVHTSPLSRSEQRAYEEVGTWRGIRSIATNACGSVFGITAEGRVLCAGENLTAGPRGDVRGRLSEFRDVTDVCTTGGECQEILIARKDGTILDLDGNELSAAAYTGPLRNGARIFRSHFWYETVFLDREKRLMRISHGDVSEVFKNSPPIASFAIGDCGFGKPFVIAVAE